MNIPDKLIYLVGNQNAFPLYEIEELLKKEQQPAILAEICKRSDISLKRSIEIATTTRKKAAVLATLQRNDISFKQSIKLLKSTGYVNELEPWPIIVGRLDTPLQFAIESTIIYSSSHDRWVALIKRKDFSAAKFLEKILSLTWERDAVNSTLSCALETFTGNKVITYLRTCSPKMASYYLNRANFWRLSQVIVERKDLPLSMLMQFTEVVNDSYCYGEIYNKSGVIKHVMSLPHEEAVKHVKRYPKPEMFNIFFNSYSLGAETLVSYLSEIQYNAWLNIVTKPKFVETFYNKGVSELCTFAKKINKLPFWKFVIERDGFKYYLSNTLSKEEAIEIVENSSWPYLVEIVYLRKDISFDDTIKGLKRQQPINLTTLWNTFLESKGGRDYIAKTPLEDVTKKLKIILSKDKRFWSEILKRKDLSPKWKIDLAKRLGDSDIWDTILNDSKVKVFLKPPA